MENEYQREQRMYGLVPYNLSPIQQGIQFGHAVVEYGLSQKRQDPDDTNLTTYNRWAHYDKTFIILNGGTTNKREFSKHFGTLNQALRRLENMSIPHATFNEPDLDNALTAVVFLVDERVFDKVKYPDYDGLNTENPEVVHYEQLFGDEAPWILELREFLSQFRLA